jgi:hypothetical protein
MIKIIDDVLPQAYADHIAGDALHYLQYFWNEKTVMNVEVTDPNVYDIGQFTCPLINVQYNGQYKNSDYMNFLKPMLLIIEEKLRDTITVQEYLRVKYNLMLQVDKKYEDMYNTPHPDNDVIGNKNQFSIIYYTNDSDGDTVFFNEFFDGNLSVKNPTIYQRVKPKKNRLVLFQSDRFHASSNPIKHPVRSVINFIMRATPYA